MIEPNLQPFSPPPEDRLAQSHNLLIIWLVFLVTSPYLEAIQGPLVNQSPS